jgi:hypothetical protein
MKKEAADTDLDRLAALAAGWKDVRGNRRIGPGQARAYQYQAT